MLRPRAYFHGQKRSHDMSPTSKTTHICLVPIGGTKSHCFSASDILCLPKCASAQCHRCATEQDGRGALDNVLGSGSERSLLVAARERPSSHKKNRYRVLFVPNICTAIPRLSISIRVRWACPVRCYHGFPLLLSVQWCGEHRATFEGLCVTGNVSLNVS